MTGGGKSKFCHEYALNEILMIPRNSCYETRLFQTELKYIVLIIGTGFVLGMLILSIVKVLLTHDHAYYVSILSSKVILKTLL